MLQLLFTIYGSTIQLLCRLEQVSCHGLGANHGGGRPMQVCVQMSPNQQGNLTRGELQGPFSVSTVVWGRFGGEEYEVGVFQGRGTVSGWQGL